MVRTVLLALFASMSLAEGSLVPSLKHLLNTHQMKAAKLNGADATGAFARLLKHGKSPLQSVGLSSERRLDALRQVAARRLDTHAPVCNETSYSDNVCENEVDTSSFPIACTQLSDVEYLSFETGIVDDQLFYFSFMEAGCTGLGIGLGLGKNWENSCIYYPSDEEEYFKVSCEEVPPTFATRSLGTCEVRQYTDSQCSGSYESSNIPSGCTRMEDEGQVLYVLVQEIKNMFALVAYQEEGCTGASAAVMLGQAEDLSKCAQFGGENEYIRVQCERADSSASSLMMSSVPYYLACGIIWLFYSVV